MSILQNLDVHGTFGVRRGKFGKPRQINTLSIDSKGGHVAAQAGRADQLARYTVDLYRENSTPWPRICVAEALPLSEVPSAAPAKPCGRQEEAQ
jgi:hypothetical protein